MLATTKKTSKAVMTVRELVKLNQDLPNVRLGARVATAAIEYQTTPEFKLSFEATDAGSKDLATAVVIPVTYRGIKPDTFQTGRDVILEGDFRQGRFEAKTLLTQCPSKYEPPTYSNPSQTGSN